MTDTTAVPGSWGELLGRDYGRATTVLAGGVALYAINEFITMSLLPSVVADIGGARLYDMDTTQHQYAPSAFNTAGITRNNTQQSSRIER